MAIAKNGINGPFSGKIGAVVGYLWKGRPVMRALPKKTKKKPSLKQLANRQQMALTQGFLKHITRVLRKGFAELAEEQGITSYMVATSYNKLHAIVGEYPNLQLDPSLVRVSSGSLPGAVQPQLSALEGGIKITWADNQSLEGADRNDRIVILAYQPGEASFGLILGGAYRKDQEEFLSLVDQPSGAYEVYIAFTNLEGDRFSDSTHIGTINWVEEHP